jgi:Domain of unknown function (DUF4288)
MSGTFKGLNTSELVPDTRGPVRRLATVKRFGAKLLFKFRAPRPSGCAANTCEERTIIVLARTAQSAFRKASAVAKRSQVSYLNDYGESVRLEFLGVLELLQLDPVCRPDEVWYDIVDLNDHDLRRVKFVSMPGHVGPRAGSRQG